MNQPIEGKAGRYWRVLEDGRIQCDVCPRYCRLNEAQRGLCFVRAREGDEIVVERIAERAEADAKLMQFFQKQGIVPDAQLIIEEVVLVNGTISLTAPNGTLVLGLEAAAQVLVRPKESMPLHQFPAHWQESRMLVETSAPG